MALTDVKFGAADVSFKSTSLGRTEGGVTLTIEFDFHDFSSDQTTMMESSDLVGERAFAAVPLAEYTFANLEVAFPMAARTTDGSKERLDIGGGSIATADYGQFKIEPVNKASDNEDVTLHKALCKKASPVPFNKPDTRIVATEWHAYRDTSQDSNAELLSFGDLTI